MRMMRQLGREDWIEAGLAILGETGPADFRVEPTARRLGVSKGSFYWHFRDRAAWRDAVLGYWEHLAFAALVPRRDAGRKVTHPDDVAGRALPAANPVHPRDLTTAGRLTVPETSAPDLSRLERALALWARDDAWVARSVSRVQAERKAGAGSMRLQAVAA